MTREFNLPDEVRPHVAEQLATKSWEELEVLEHAGYLLFPEKLYRRAVDGTFIEQAVTLRVPRMHEMREARVQARALATSSGIDPHADRDLFDDLEVVCILSRAIRNSTPPHEPWEPEPLVLEKRWDKQCLVQIWAKLDALNHVIDPRPDDISREEMLVLMAKIVKERNLGPLAVYGSGAQAHFVTTMAEMCLTSLESASSSVSPEP